MAGAIGRLGPTAALLARAAPLSEQSWVLFPHFWEPFRSVPSPPPPPSLPCQSNMRWASIKFSDFSGVLARRGRGGNAELSLIGMGLH